MSRGHLGRRDRGWYHTDGRNWYTYNNDAWHVYKFDKSLGKKAYREGYAPGADIVVPRHRIDVRVK